MQSMSDMKNHFTVAVTSNVTKRNQAESSTQIGAGTSHGRTQSEARNLNGNMLCRQHSSGAAKLAGKKDMQNV